MYSLKLVKGFLFSLTNRVAQIFFGLSDFLV